MAKLIACRLNDGRLYGYGFYCPACRDLHHFNVAIFQPLWSFDGNLDAPTFGPSLRLIGGNGCHLFVLGGMIQYCGDSRHELAGKTVPMVDYDFERRCPVSVLHTINGRPVEETRPAPSATETIFAQATSAPPPMTGGPASLTDPSVAQSPKVIPVADPTVTASNQVQVSTHRAECGNVGNVGAVGDLGSNAKS
jgi:hypothetical protein